MSSKDHPPGMKGSTQVSLEMTCIKCGEPLARGTGEPYTMTAYPRGLHRSCGGRPKPKPPQRRR